MVDENVENDESAEGEIGPIGKSVIRGAGIFGFIRVSTGGLSAVVRVIGVASLLGPREFGLFGAALLVLSVLDVLSQTGFESALVQRRGKIDSHLDTAFVSHIIRGLTLASIIYFGAPLIVRLFQNPVGLLQPLHVLAIVPILTGFQNIAAVHLSRDLKYGRLALYNSTQPIVELVVSIGYAMISPTVWSLVCGRIAGVGVKTVLSYLVVSERPRIRFNMNDFKDLHVFGIWVFLSGMIAFTLFKGGDFVIAAMLPIQVLGLYQFADTIGCRVTTDLTRVLNTVTFPAFAKIHTQKARMRRAFHKSFSRICVFVFWITAGIIVTARPLVDGFMSDKWQSAIPLIQILAVWGASRALGATSSSLFMAIGRPHLATIYQFVMLVLFAIGIVPAILGFGAIGVATLLACIGMSIQFFRLPLLARVLEESPRIHVGILSATGVACAISVGAGIYFDDFLRAMHPIVRLGVSGVFTTTVYLGVVLLLDRIFRKRLDLIPTIPSQYSRFLKWNNAG